VILEKGLPDYVWWVADYAKDCELDDWTDAEGEGRLPEPRVSLHRDQERLESHTLS
jgi:hypothetical protein